MKIFAIGVVMLSLASVAFGQNGTIVVLNKSDASTSLIDEATGEERARVEVREGPHEVAISPDGKTAVVANYGAQTPGSSLSFIDIASAEVTNVIDLDGYTRPHGIQFLPDGTRIAITAEQQQSLIIVNVESGEVDAAIKTDQAASHMLVLSPDGARAYVSNIGSGSLTVIDLKTSQRLKNIPTGGGAEGLDISPDGRELWVANRAENTISIIDTKTLEVSKTLSCGQFPIRLKFTPDGTHALVSCAVSGEVAVIDAKSRIEHKRFIMGGNQMDSLTAGLGPNPVPIGILIPPHGQAAYIANSNANSIAVINLNHEAVAETFETGPTPDGLGYSPVRVSREH